jgi:Arylsulfotransferase (ASST)/Divergent InlB B-repeat domain/Ser-Thr-rich glycosyl-phosphatidyl-inositol-anchored membrane family
MKLKPIICRGASAGVMLALITGVARADDVSVAIATVPGGLSVTVDGTNYSAPAVFTWASGSAHTLVAQSPQTSADNHARYSFTSWNDGGAQTNQIVTPDSDTNYTATFSTQYLLDVNVAPTGGGSVSNYPAGPWYDAGQLVSLTAKTNTGYRIYFWQGVDSAVGSTAQVMMNGYHLAQAAFIPSDYPYVVVTNSSAAAPGSLIGNIDGRTADGTKLYYVVLDNTGTNVLFANKTNTLYRFVTPQGFDAVAGTGTFNFKDETINTVASITTLGYTLDNHDVKLLPNGHALVFGTEVRTVDMSQMVTNGKTAASVTGDIIQEIDANNRLVFEWHTFDYIPITNTFADVTQASFDYAHINAMTIDPTDNNLLASLRTTSEIVKINRQTGQVMWRLGGKMNQFTFIGEHPENAPYYTVGQHDVHRLANGNLLYFDNGNISGGGATPNDRTYSRGVEYQLDEVNKIATLVWEFRHSPDISAPCTGSIKRLANGNTTIGWGCAIPTSGTIITEVSPAGNVVFEMKHRTAPGSSALLLGNGLTKQLWNSPDLIRSAAFQALALGQTYDSPDAGVSVTVNSLTGSADNALVVQRHLDAVRFPLFSGKAPQVVMEHIVLSGSNIVSLEAELNLNLPDTSYACDTPVIQNPAQVVVYQRPTPGQGQFSALATTYDSGTQKLRVTTTQLGEFIFAYPDLAETPYVPTILSPADQSQVNQSQAITLTWKPQGLVGSFDLQVATDAGFANLVLDTNGLGSNNFILQNPLPNTHYFWRVRTINQGGATDWVAASFTTVPPMLHMTYPAGGEVWQRFQVVTIRWIDNISENVALDLYKDGVSNRTFVASTASSGSCTWNVGQFSALPQSTNYTIKIRSTTSPALFDFSNPFSIITNLTSVTIATVPTNLTVTVDGTNYISRAVFNWLPTSSHSIAAASPQVASDGHSRSVFVAWSDGGAQNHSITVPFSAATNTASFSTNYLLDITAPPAEAGTVTANPAGPWYDIGQVVSLTANPNSGYLIYTWQGVDTQAGNTAQVTLNSYKSVQAKFMPNSGVPFINAASFARLADGRMQFNLTAGAGVATQATVWGATTLLPPDWWILGTVPLTAGSGVFIDNSAPTAAIRFYRVSLP